MHVRVDQAGHQRAPAEVDDARPVRRGVAAAPTRAMPPSSTSTPAPSRTVARPGEQPRAREPEAALGGGRSREQRREARPASRGRSSGSRAARMSTRSPRNGIPSASSSRRWRSPLASEPSARTIRCQGTSSSHANSTVPAKRGAPARRRRRCARSRAACCAPAPGRARRGCPRTWSIPAVSSAAPCPGPTARTRSSRSTRRRGSGRRGPVALDLRRLALHLGRPRARRRRHQSVVEPAHGPHALDRLARGRGRTPPRSPACSRPTRSRRCARSGSSTRAARRRPHRRRLHPRGRATRRRRPLGVPGQHDGPRDRARCHVPPPSSRAGESAPSG